MHAVGVSHDKVREYLKTSEIEVKIFAPIFVILYKFTGRFLAILPIYILFGI